VVEGCARAFSFTRLIRRRRIHKWFGDQMHFVERFGCNTMEPGSAYVVY